MEALKFGAPGGAALGAGFILSLGAGDGVSTTDGLVMGLLFGASIGGLVGLVAAHVTLVLAGMSADATNRGVGVIVAFCVAFAASFLMLRFLALGPAAYAAIVAWFRLSHIVDGAHKCGKPVHEPGASVGE